MEEFYTVNEIAEMFKVTRTTVYEWMNSGKLKWVRVGGRRRVTKAAVSQFIQAGSQEADEGTIDNEIPGIDLAPAVEFAR